MGIKEEQSFFRQNRRTVSPIEDLKPVSKGGSTQNIRQRFLKEKHTELNPRPNFPVAALSWIFFESPRDERDSKSLSVKIASL